MVAQGVDQLVLVHLRTALDADLLRPLLEILLAPVVVGAGLAALLGGRRGVGVGDPRPFLLARALIAQPLVALVVLPARAVVLRHWQAPCLGWSSSVLPLSLDQNSLSGFAKRKP